MVKHSMLYNSINLYEIAYLRIEHYETFLPPPRERKIVVPNRPGAYDFGAEDHDERSIRMECLIEREITDAQFDTLKYTLARKGRIYLWDKPDRYFYGQCYDSGEVLEYMRKEARTFSLTFTCEPYAYALEPTVLTSTGPVIPISYEGTRKTPTRITIRNTGSTPLQGVTITAREIV